jgi:hypothetical protein
MEASPSPLQTINDATPRYVRRKESSLKKPTTNFSNVFVTGCPDPRGPRVAGSAGSSCRPLPELYYFLVVTITQTAKTLYYEVPAL